jgi:hypothetical protein
VLGRARAQGRIVGRLLTPTALTAGTPVSSKYPIGLKTVLVMGSNLPQAPPAFTPT